eukprot:CAMPEP_0119547306 /NCGR_PEP_ID=MMETSP1352-20130426/1448_1 /TAXON_ID=265584 /ORGANISM="Stauroneis constricta, Strain CCMP1120" /LENGTH=243 /DNA_ID=CAMNT_0007592183 /DNA_START=459 /DNA_END=1190 /DNA_ORIENTATION=+
MNLPLPTTAVTSDDSAPPMLIDHDEPFHLNADDNDDDSNEIIAAPVITTTTKQKPSIFRMLWFCFGIILGCTIQLITIYTHTRQMIVTSGETSSSSSSSSSTTAINNITTMIGKNIDILFYAIIWCLFLCTMTSCGYQYFKRNFAICSTQQQLYQIGSNILLGMIIGSFMAWLYIDVVKGVPLSIVSITTTITIDIILCYFLLSWSWCDDNDNDDNEHDDNEFQYHHYDDNGETKPISLAQIV